MNKRTFIAFSILLTIASTFSIFANDLKAASTEDVKYFAVFMGGSKVGHSRHIRKVSGQKVTTTEQMSINIARGPITLNVKTEETAIETIDGKPLGFKTSENMGTIRKTVFGKINKDGQLKISILQMGDKLQKVIDFPEGAMMTEALRQMQIEKGLTPNTQYTAKVFSPAIQEAVDAKITIGQKVQIDLLGRILPLTKVDMNLSSEQWSLDSTLYVNSEFVAEKTVTELMGIRLELVACDKQFALSKNDVVDFLDRLLIQSPANLKGLKRSDTMEYHINATNGAKLNFPQTPSQHPQKTAAGFIVTVKPVIADRNITFPITTNDPDILKALSPNEYIQSDDPKIKGLAKTAVGNTKNAADAAKKIEAFVKTYITEKDLSVGFASASEVAASKQGDCTEHAVLTAAMCRAVGIPARLAFGVVYADSFLGKRYIFGGHAWTQAYIGNQWIDLDATRAPTDFTAGHITLSLSDGKPADFFNMVNTLGYFQINKANRK